MNSRLGIGGDLGARVIKAPRPHNARSIRTPLGRIWFSRDTGDAGIFSSEVFASNLQALHFGDRGKLREAYDLGSGLVTHAGVRLLSQDTAVTAGTAALAAFKNHGSGTGTTAAAATDTALQTAIGTTATAGANTNADASPNATITSIGTISYTGTFAVTEWGLFNQTTLSGATMWDHKVFSAINVISGDSIQFTYTLTINSGG